MEDLRIEYDYDHGKIFMNRLPINEEEESRIRAALTDLHTRMLLMNPPDCIQFTEEGVNEPS